jgi:hypothetical protein
MVWVYGSVGKVGLGVAPPAVHYRAKNEGEKEEDCFKII